MKNTEVSNEIKAAFLANQKVTLMEKGNPYDVWELVKTPRTVRWRKFYTGEKGTVKDLSEFFECTDDLAILRIE